MSEDARPKGIVLVSGGMDSLVLAAFASRESETAFLHVNYGQRTQERELACFHAIADHFAVRERLVVDITHLTSIGGSALTDPSIPLPDADLRRQGIPATYVPFRNAHFLAAAVSWAEVLGANRRAELEDGTAIQIALYASMLRGGGDYPPAGYFILSEGDLLTVTPQAFPEATAAEGPSAHETLRAAEERFRAWRSVLAKGVLPLCADDLPWEEAVAEAGGPERDGVGEAARDTACRFCRFTTLCRARVGEERP